MHVCLLQTHTLEMFLKYVHAGNDTDRLLATFCGSGFDPESEIFTGDTSKGNHSPGPVIKGN